MTENIIDKVKEGLPDNAQVADIAFEGSEIVVYTENPDIFTSNGDFIKPLVSKLKKRIDVRPDPSITKDMEEVQEKIREIVPEGAGVEEITFEPAFSRVTIEAHKPGLVIGKGGSTLQQIRKETLWSPLVKRAPAIESDVVGTIREVLFNESEFRKDFLNDIGKSIHRSDKKEIEWVRLTTLGSFQEVGRSCMLLSSPNSNVMMDCGIKPSDPPEFPYLNIPEFDMGSLDAVVISHAHLDHVGFLPYLYEYGYEGPVYCTAPTRDLMTLLCLDYVDLAQRERGDAPYSKDSIKKAIKHSVILGYDEVSDITPDMRLTFQNAGHILGSALTHIHVGEGLHNVVYTADHNFSRSRLLDPAFTDFQRIETLITESTYAEKGAVQPSRREAEEELEKTILRAQAKGGKVLIPSFAVERSQEMMAVLADMDDLEVPVYLDGMLWDATAIHTTYPEQMSDKIKQKIFHEGKNPFTSDIFQRVGSRQEREELIESTEPCVVIATSGMLVGGPSVEYFKNFAEDDRNAVIFVGHQAHGTLGSKIEKGRDEVPVEENGKRKVLEVNLDVTRIKGFSGHSDVRQLTAYIGKLNSKPNFILCNHGEASRCKGFASHLHKKFRVRTRAPQNLETIRLV